MILTGKALEDFYSYLDNQDLAPYKVMFEEVPLIVKTYYIIEWFDSVGIYILIFLDETNRHKFKYLITNKNKTFARLEEGTNKDTRKEATVEAIKKANEIYNNLNK